MIEDKIGERWQKDANAHFAKVGPEGWLENPHPLPDFNGKRPAHVKRALLGRFLYDRDTGILHDAHAAKPECAIDQIANGTFYHFAHEISPEHSEQRCPRCMG